MRGKRYILFLVVLVFIDVCASDGLCQYGYKPYVMILNGRYSPAWKPGVYFIITLLTDYIGQMNSVKKITAANTVSDIDHKIYAFSLTQLTRNFIGEYVNVEDEFSGQYGTYKVIVEYGNGSVIMATTDPVPPNSISLSIPTNLRVSFEKGSHVPKLSLDPVDPGIDFDIYDLRIYDKDYSRRIYNTQILSSEAPEISFPANRTGGQTAEDLVPGETYIFRADIRKGVQSNVNALVGRNFLYFKVPKE